MAKKDMNDLTYDELMHKYRGFKDELMQLRFQHATGQLEKTHRIKEVRKNIARVLTFIGRQELAAQNAAEGAES